MPSENPSTATLSFEAAFRALDAHAVEWVEPLRQAAAGVVTGVSLSRVVRDALTAVADALGADAASILIADDSSSALVARSSVGLVVEVDLEIDIKRGEGYAGKILESGRPLVVDDLENFEVKSPVLRSSGLKSIAGVPLLAGERVVGVLHASSKTPRHFTEEEVALLERVSYLVAAAIERVRLFDHERNLRRAAELSAARLAALQEVTAALANLRDVVEVCQTIVDRALPGQAEEGGEAGIWMLQDGRLKMVVAGPRAADFDEIPLTPDFPAKENLETGEPFFVETAQEIARRWPVLADAGTNSFAGFALKVGEKRLGVMAIGYREEHRFDENERTYLAAVAEQAGLALDRAQAAAAEREAAERRSFLADASLALTNRYASPEQLLENLARLAVPRLCDWCSVIREEAGSYSLMAVAHALEALPEATRLAEALSVEDRSGVLQRVFLTGRPTIIGAAGSDPIDPESYGGYARTIGLTSAMIVPIEGHGRTIGVMAFVAASGRPAYSTDDLELAGELASRAGRMVEDLTQRARERALTERLTRALLPARLPELRGISLAARYLPAESGPVGGDWYDAFELPDRRLALVVGDVGGHGVEAASTMGRLRNGLFAFASEGHDPASTLARLSDLLGNDSQDWNLPDPIASVLFAALDRESLLLTSTCAGHPPWVLIREGKAELQECGGRVLAANLPAVPFEKDHQLRPGDVCVFMTDGLVERSDEDFDDSVERFRRAAETHAGLSVDALADALVEETMPPRGRTDDCCLLALQVTEASVDA